MILQALKEYYDRKPDLPSWGWFQGKIDFVVILDSDGNFIQTDCLQDIKNGKRIPHPCRLPYIGKQARKHTMSGKDANLLWDNSTFVLGLRKNGKTKLDSFISIIEEKLGDLNDQGVEAVLKFLKKGQNDKTVFAPIIKHTQFGEEIREGRSALTFRLLNDSQQFVFDRPIIKARISEGLESEESRGICLVTGEKDQPIELCHLVIKNLYGAQKDPNLVSFNLPAFNSFHKEQSANAPVGKAAAFAYTTALNHLVARESMQKLRIGDATAVFWSASNADLEKQISNFFSEPPEHDPDRGVRAVVSLFKVIQTGAFAVDEGKTKFFVLGMTPFGPRIAVRFWIIDTVHSMSKKICDHFIDTEIAVPVYGNKDWPRWLPLDALLAATANQTKYDKKKNNLVRFRGKYYDVKPHLGGDTMRAILEDLPYPLTLLQAAIQRIRAEQDITYPRASLIKACINRSVRFKNHETQEELKMSLDENNINIGYRLGRLFAALEMIQIEAHRGRKLNTTIRNRYYGAASSAPATVFGTLLNKLNPHHLEKLPEGLKVVRQKLLRKIVDEIDGNIAFPPYLSLEDQGRFAIGYYHQMQVLYTKK